MAPEQFGSGLVDARADVYGLAATLFFTLTGRPPFRADGLAALARAITQDEAPSVEGFARGVSAATVTLVMRCLSKDPARRPVDAGAMLREIEKVRGGEPLELEAHPRMPAGSSRVKEYVHTWDLAAPPNRLWPYVSNTERLNRAAGLPSVNYSFLSDPSLGNRRFAKARVAGMKMEWEEHPYEWVEGRRMGVLREFSRGPFAWFLSVVELEPLPSGGTRLRHCCEPSHVACSVGWRLVLSLDSKPGRSLGRIYRRMDEVLSGRTEPIADAFENPSRIPRSRELRVRAGVNRLVAAGAGGSRRVDRHLFVQCSEQEVARIRPLALGAKIRNRRRGDDRRVPSSGSCRIAAIAVDVICPLCRIPSGRKDTLRELKEHEHCTACSADFQTDFAASVELVFKAHPDIRSAEAGAFCAGGPAHSPHVVAQARVASGERLELNLELSEGAYRVRGPQLTWSLDIRIETAATGRRCEVDLGAAAPTRGLVLGGRPGSRHTQRLAARDRHSRERASSRDDVLTAAQAIALPAFRDLFWRIAQPGQLAPPRLSRCSGSRSPTGIRLWIGWVKRRRFSRYRRLSVIENGRAEGGVVVAVGEG